MQLGLQLKKLVNDKRFQALACALGGIIIVVVAFIIFRFVPRTRKDRITVSRSRENLSSEPVNKNVANQVPAGNRKLSTIKESSEETEEEDSTASTTNTTTEAVKNQKNSKSSDELKETQKKDESCQLPSPPISEEVKKPPVSCDEWKVKIETLLSKLDRNTDASEVNEATSTLDKMFEVCSLPKEPLKDYLRKSYESKRDVCLGAKVAGENNLKELKRMLEGLQVVDSSYKDDSLELRFVEKFVNSFIEPFKELETRSSLEDTKFATLVTQANKAFPLARIFASFVPLSAPQELQKDCKHASFSHKNLSSFLEHIIPKLIEDVKDAESEVTVRNYIRILCLLKPKSSFAFEDEKSLDAYRKTITNTLASYFELPPPQKPLLEYLDFEKVKNMPVSDLQNLITQTTMALSKYNEYSLEYSVCKHNIAMLEAICVNISNWDPNIFNAWKNTGFKTTSCPEFVNWVEQITKRSGDKLFQHVIDMHKFKSKDFCEDEALQALIASAAWHITKYPVPGEFRQKMLTFLKSEEPSDAKILFDSGEVKPMLRQYFDSMTSKFMDSKIKFSCNIIYFMSQLGYVSESPTNITNFSVKLNAISEDDKPEDAFALWTACVSAHGEEQCWNELELAEQHHINTQRIEDIELKYKSFIENGKPGNLKYDYMEYADGKFGLLMAFHTYVDMRKYFDKVNEAKASFTFDPNMLSFNTNQMNIKLHDRLCEYSKGKEWKSLKGIMYSLKENLKSIRSSNDKLGVLYDLTCILEVCKPNNYCKMDRVGKKISCSDYYSSARLKNLAKLTGKMATYCQNKLDEAFQATDLDIYVEKLNSEADLIRSNKDILLFPVIDDYLYPPVG